MEFDGAHNQVKSLNGCTSNCLADVDGDGAVTVSDLLDGILAAFGQACP